MLDGPLPSYALPPCDGYDDITDVWLEETDPENELGEICEAGFDDDARGYPCRCSLVGIRVTRDGWSIPLPREIAVRLLGPMTVTRLERLRAARLDEEI